MIQLRPHSLAPGGLFIYTNNHSQQEVPYEKVKQRVSNTNRGGAKKDEAAGAPDADSGEPDAVSETERPEATDTPVDHTRRGNRELVPQVEPMPETAFYEMMERVLMLPDVAKIIEFETAKYKPNEEGTA